MRFRFALGLAALMLSLFGTSAATAQGTHLHAVLVGGNETPSAGHPTAFGTAAVSFRGTNQTQVCVVIVVHGLPAPTAAHIHPGFGPEAKPFVVLLNTPAAGNPGFSSGCYPISAALSQQIRARPSAYYINIHTDPHPGGAIRGQLFQ